MSKSVWFEQIDSSLLDFVSSIVFVNNSEGIKVPVPVIIRKPEEDFKIEVYPSVSLYNLYSMLNRERLDDIEEVIVNRDFEKGTLNIEKVAIPFVLAYQIDFWSKYQSDMNLMTQLWLSHTGRYFNLPVKDQSGNDRNVLVMLSDSISKQDLLDGSDRIYHSFATYKVFTELDEEIQSTIPMVSNIRIDKIGG